MSLVATVASSAGLARNSPYWVVPIPSAGAAGSGAAACSAGGGAAACSVGLQAPIPIAVMNENARPDLRPTFMARPSLSTSVARTLFRRPAKTQSGFGRHESVSRLERFDIPAGRLRQEEEGEDGGR